MKVTYLLTNKFMQYSNFVAKDDLLSDKNLDFKCEVLSGQSRSDRIYEGIMAGWTNMFLTSIIKLIII